MLPDTIEISGEGTVPHHLQTKALKGQKMKVQSTHPARLPPARQSTAAKALVCTVKSSVIIA